MKGVTHNHGFEGGFQWTKGKIKKRSYHPWFDHVYLRMCEKFSEQPSETTHLNLMEETPDDDHPLSILSNEAVNALWKHLLRTNTALYSSRIAGLYSRLGGAYGQTSTNKNVRDDIAVMPIYATVYDEDDSSKPPKRWVSGVCFRGPNHARNPTDRIPIVTIERFKTCEENINLLWDSSKSYWMKGPTHIYLVRQNSIIREDPCYLMFNINSLFLPTNLYGISLLQKPNSAANLNVRGLIKNMTEEEKAWYTDRFTEGVIMSAIGNSRDEGYFAFLRKLFMVLFEIKKGYSSASLDIESFCEKANECLVDNPLSMYFHMNLLTVIQYYIRNGIPEK